MGISGNQLQNLDLMPCSCQFHGSHRPSALSFHNVPVQMGIFLKRISIAFLFLFFWLATATSPVPICHSELYGRPDPKDCTALFEKIISSQNFGARFFDEEQLRAEGDHSWPGVTNVFPQPIVQLPKYFSMSP